MQGLPADQVNEVSQKFQFITRVSESPEIRSTIRLVGENRVADVRGVCADLVGPSRVELKPEEREVLGHGNCLVVGPCEFSLWWLDNSHTFAVALVSTQITFY